MSISASHENRFYAHAMAGLMDATKRRKSLETNFERKRLREYDDVCDEQIGYAVELLKIGADCEFKDDKICILADNGDLIEFTADEIKEQIGESAFYILFPPEKPQEEEIDPDMDMDFDEFESEISKRNENSIIPSMEDYQKAMLFNPMAMMLPIVMDVMKKNMERAMPSPRTGYQGDPIAAVQEQIDNLKESRDRIKKKAIRYKTEYEKVKSQYADLCRENEEMDQIANENQKAFLEEKKQLEGEMEKLTKSISEKEMELLEKEQELKDAKEQLSEGRSKESEEKKSAEEKISFLSTEIDKGKNEINDLRNNLSHKQVELDQKQKELSLKQQELSQKQDALNRKEKEIQRLQNELARIQDSDRNVAQRQKELEDQISLLKDENDKYRQEKEALSERLKKAEANNNELLNKINNTNSAQDGSKKRVENLQNENNNLRNKNRELERNANESDNAKKKAEEQYEKLLSEYEALKEENQVLKEVAYRDAKFEVGNTLGFQGYINQKEKELKFVAMVDVCGMKNINDEYEEEIGDGVIKSTIEALCQEFGHASVFRVRGAQFAIIFAAGNYGQIRKQLEKVKEKLKSIQEFDIVYGLASLERSSSRQDMVDKARMEMKKMKADWDLFNTPSPAPVEQSYQEAYPMNQSQDQPYIPNEFASNGSSEPVPESTPANPNMAVNMFEDAYKDADTVKEVDATSMDLAHQIMDMMTHN